jgi:hypothetical protein
MPAVPGQERTTFSEEQKRAIINSYDNGLNTTKKENHPKLNELAGQLQLTFENVKVLFF